MSRLETKDLDLFQKAIKAAKRQTWLKYPPVAAVLVIRNKVLSRHLNSPKTHPKADHYYRQRLHAEHAALLEEAGDTLVIARISKDKTTILNSKPCFRCMKLILEAAHIKSIVYMLNGTLTQEKTGAT